MTVKLRVCLLGVLLMGMTVLVTVSAPAQQAPRAMSEAQPSGASALSAPAATVPDPGPPQSSPEEGAGSTSQLTAEQWQEVQLLVEELSLQEPPRTATIDEISKAAGVEIVLSPEGERPLFVAPGSAQRAPIPCPANSMFSQLAHEPTDPWTGATSNQNVNGSDLTRFESYSVAADICDVHWWAFNRVLLTTWTECDKTAGGTITERVNIRFYADAGGQPAAIPTCEYLNVDTFIRTDTGVSYSGRALYQYDLDLTPLGCCTLTSGWISIEGVDDGQNCWLLWLSSPDGDGSSCMDQGAGITCNVIGESDFDLSACLTGAVAPGACCDQDTGVCNDTPPVDFFACMASGPNMRFIENGLCTDFTPPCGVPFGACCFTDGSCQESTDVNCATDGGVFLGDGSSCTPNPCPQPCACPVTISAYPYAEDFEAGMGDWTNSLDDDYDWTRDSGGTPSSGTGPSGDHTTGTGFYMFTESSSPVATGDVAILDGPCFDLTGLTNPTATFFYHMLGSAMGTLEFDVSADSCLTWTTEFSMTGDQGDAWHLAVVDLTAYAGQTINVRFRGIRGTSFTSDMAIDDFGVDEAQVFTGACCFIDGSCQVLSETDCGVQGGTYSGDLTVCVPNTCPQPCTCATPISTFPHTEDFETESQCGTSCGNTCVLAGSWTNETDDDMDWTSDVGGTTSSSTGPSQDANPGTPAGFYLYTETSGGSCQGVTATLLSPCYDVSALTSPQLVFAYHMYGAAMGDLHVDVSTDLCATWTTELSILGEQHTANDDPWTYVVVDLSAYAGATSLRIRLRGVTGTSFTSDMAIDDITLREAQVTTGACCTGAACTENVSEAACIAGGGTYLGDFSNCGPPNPCVGACCLTDGSCQELTDADCLGAGGAPSGGGTTCTLNPCPPVNDTCDSAEDIPAVPFSTTFDNSLANADGPPGSGSCNSSSAVVMQNDVWYSYTPTADCFLILDVDPDFGGGYDGIMQLYTGPDCNNLTEFPAPGSESVGCFDDPEPWHTEFFASAGTTYWFQIGDWGTIAGGGLTSFDLTCGVGTFGACCHMDGSCSDQPGQAACDAASGLYQGDFTTCTATSCPQPCPCSTPIGAFPYNEDFEGEPTCPTSCGSSCVLVGDWTNIDDGTDDMDWTVDEGGTSSTNTGPSQDANPGTSTGNYAYTETSGSSCQNATAILLSPCFDVSGMTDPVLLFAYHMYGANIGDLHVEVSKDDCFSWTTELTISGEQQTDNTDPWRYAAVDLSVYLGATDLRVRFRAVTGGSFNGDMAIDDISLVNGPITGACCESDGSCTDNVQESACTAGGGNWQGPFSDCAGSICGGACCLPTGCADVPSASACASAGGSYEGDGSACAQGPCPPVNDACDTASPITAIPFSAVFDNSLVGADGPPGSCNSSSAVVMQNDVWFSFTPTDDCIVSLDVDPDFGSGYDGIMQLYTGPDCSNLTQMSGLPGEDDPGCFDLNEPWHVEFFAVIGTTYWFQIGDWGTSPGGGLTSFDLSCAPAPEGACCTGAGCVIDSQGSCALGGGIYAGDNTACSGTDCNNNGSDDFCDIFAGTTPDCNDNSTPDDCDISAGTSDDFDQNGVPDECDPDCNGNDITDGCDVDCTAGNCVSHPLGCGGSEDCQPDGIPDDCQLGAGGGRAETLLHAQAVIPDDTGIGPGGLLAIGSSCPFDNTSAEDFTPPETASITRVTWEGVYFGAAPDFPGVDNNFHLTIYEDNGAGNVGAIVADFPSVTVTKALHARPPIFGSNPVYTYDVTLPAPVPVSGGQRYWLSINGDPGGATGPVFGWMASAEGNAATIPGNDQPLQNTTTPCAALPATTYTPGGDLSDQDSDLAFALYGQVGGGGADCNGNLVPDDCDIAGTTSEDCNSDGVPDECQLAGNDCNTDGIPDDCQLDNNDCDDNQLPDDCQIAAGTSQDCQPDGIPDECQLFDTGRVGPVIIDEAFDDILTLPGDGWVQTNNSAPPGLIDWFQGSSTAFPSHQGAPDAYIAANFNNCGDGIGLDTISNWLITPEVTLENGMELSFWTRKADTPPSQWPDRLEVRMSLAGASTNVGSSEFSVGDFTTLLLEINPTLVIGGYPDVWTQYQVTISGLGAPTNGRLAFRYFVTDAGPTGTNSDYIGIDTVTVTGPAGPPPNDCNTNGVPDECDPDCDLDGVPDDCDLDVCPACFGLNKVEIHTRNARGNDDDNKLEIKGAFLADGPIDFDTDDVTYTVEDGFGFMYSLTIPAGSFEQKGDPAKQKYKYKSPSGSDPKIKAKFDLLKGEFKLRVSHIPDTGQIAGLALTIGLRVGINAGAEVVEMVDEGHELEFKREPKLDCTPGCEGISFLQVTSDQGVFEFRPEPNEYTLPPITTVDDGVNGPVSLDTDCSDTLQVGNSYGAYVITDLVEVFDLEFELMIEANVESVFIDSSLLDLYSDGGDYSTYDLDYNYGTVVTLTAPPVFENGRFIRWEIDGVPQTPGGTGPVEAITVTVLGDYTLAAVYMIGDFDGDGDVDLQDYAVFTDCLGGPEASPAPMSVAPPDCLGAFDFDDDQDVDLKDAARLAAFFTGG